MRVFKFYDADSALRNISQRRLKISTVEDLNDPYEFNAIKFDSKSQRLAWNRHRRTITAERGIICFSKDWSNPVIWSHYADKHKGLALGFDIPDSSLVAVNYSKERIRYSDHVGSSVDGYFNIAKLAMITKYSSWSYENELRMWAELGSRCPETGLFFRDFGSDLVLKEVVIGHDSKVKTKDVREAIGAGSSVSVSTARLAFESYKVTPQKRKSLQR